MKSIIVLFAFALSNAAFSQLVMESEFAISGIASDTAVDQEFPVTNSGNDQVSYYWTIDRSGDVPADWVFTVCDAVLCHEKGVESCPCMESDANVLYAGATIGYNKLTLDPKGIPGEHTVRFKLSSVCDNFEGTNFLGETEFVYSITEPSSIEEEEQASSPIVYPNPTIDRFYVKNDGNVASISILNIIGKRIFTDSHIAGQTHDVSELDNGIYLVKMLDKNEQTIKVVRMTKD